MASQIAGMYDLEETLGSGHFAVVKSARHAFTGLRVAVKVIDKAKLDDISKAHLYQEVRCMKLVVHPSIIRLYEVIDTQTKLYLIEELGDGGDLYDYILKHPTGIEEDLVRRIFQQTVSAIQYCHQLHVVHRDLKPENLVFCNSGKEMQVKLTDFGLSRTFLPGEMIESACGSLEYSAPEVLLGDSYDPPKIDVWSLGVILYMLICGRSPFASGGANETLTHIMDGRYDISSHVSENCKSLIRKMLVVDPSKRVSLTEVANHQWLTQNMETDMPTPHVLQPLKLSDIHPDQVELIIERMTDGGYGDRDNILIAVNEKPYGSVAATFYLLAEAERHRRQSQGILQMAPAPPVNRKTLPQVQHHTIVSPVRSRHVETGILQPRRPLLINQTHPLVESEHSKKGNEDSPFSSPSVLQQSSPYQNPQYKSPRLGVGEEKISATNSRKPTFPIQSVSEDSSKGVTETDSVRIEPPAATIRGRQLSACEEESENDEFIVVEPFQAAVLTRSQSPIFMGSPRSRKLLSARSSPNLVKSVSRSDLSEEDEEEDDLMELSFLPRTSNVQIRHSPFTSPHLSSRNSPTHMLAYSSDEESHVTSVFEGKHKISNKRRRSRFRKLHPLVRVDSASSDDSIIDRGTRHSLPKFGKDKLRTILHGYRSVPSTPGEGSGSESFSEFLLVRRPRSNSARTDSSLSDTGDLAIQMYGRFELSDGEELEQSCDGEDMVDSIRKSPARTSRKSESVTRSAICCLL